MWIRTPAGNAPCYGCKERTAECKTSCERFRKWHAQRQAELTEFKAKRAKEGIVDSFKDDMMQKQIKRRKR